MIWDRLHATAFDFETTGELPEHALQPWRMAQGKFSLTSLSVYPDWTGATGLYPTRERCKRFLEEARAARRYIVGWNTVFDIQCLLALDLEDEVMACRWLDGMLVWKHAVVEPEYETRPQDKQHFKLKGPGSVVELLYGPEEATYGEGIDFHDPSPEARAVLQAYNDLDTKHTYNATQHWWERLTPKQRAVVLIEAESLPMVAAANLRGLPVDTLSAHDLQAGLLKTAREKLAILGPLIEPHALTIWPELAKTAAKKKQSVTELVVRSPQKLQKILFDVWQCPVMKVNTSKTTGNESYSTDKEVLHELALDGWDNVKHLHEYRQSLNRVTKFVDNVLESVDYNADGRTHPEAHVFSTYTGRMTYSSTQGKKGSKAQRQTGYAIHQEKRDKIFREKIIPPPGYELMEFDAAGQEYRWMAVQSGDETMCQMCLPGEDAHSYMGSRILEMDYKEFLTRLKAKEERISGPQGGRMLGKVGNLSLQYRTSAKRLLSTARTDYDIPLVMSQAEHIHGVYPQTYTRVPQFWKSQIDLAKRQGYVETISGRRVKIIGDWGGSFGWSMGSTAINYAIQGTGADQKYLALAVIRSYCRQNGIKFVLDMHDGLYFFVPKAKVIEARAVLSKMLNNLPYKDAWGFTPPIPLPFDCKHGPNWGAMKEWKEAA
jgi:hypothetical protein